MDRIIVVYIQEQEGTIAPVSLEIIGKAKELSKKIKHSICAVALGNEPEKVQENLSGLSVDQLFYYQTLQQEDVNLRADIVAALCRELKPGIVFIGASKEGRSLAPLAAVQLKTGLTADCTDFTIDDKGVLTQIRPAFEEKRLASIQTRTRPQMATVRPGIMLQSKRIGDDLPVLVLRKAEEARSGRGYQILSTERIRQEGKLEIGKEKLLLVLGAGVERQQDIAVFQTWAQLLGGAVACSRKLVERGWFTVERQIGLSGNASEAELMITVGVSGSVQFQAGIRKVKHLIAINRDTDAPIMGAAEQGICMDVNLLIRELRGERDN